MIDLMLEGREPEDYEAQCALRTLLESEKLKECGDDELLSRIEEQISFNQDMLARVAALVEGIRSGTSEDSEPDADGDDLLARINRAIKPRKEPSYG
jgi:hypothetical protein